jgi:hypothetical protein
MDCSNVGIRKAIEEGTATASNLEAVSTAIVAPRHEGLGECAEALGRLRYIVQ